MNKSKFDEWLESFAKPEDGYLLIEEWARDNATEKSIAEDLIGISPKSFQTRKQSDVSLVAALKKGKAPITVLVENQLVRSALGFHEPIKKPIKLKEREINPDGSITEREVVQYIDDEVYVPPVPSAIFFYLKNRKPERWADKPIPKAEEAPDDGFMDALKAAVKKEWKDV